MSSEYKTLEEVRRAGLEAVARELGPADFLRFLQLYERGRGDYTEERREWIDQLDGTTLLDQIEQRRKKLKQPDPAE